MVTVALLVVGGVAAASGLVKHLIKEIPMRVSAVQCDNPGCSNMGTPLPKLQAPEGWYVARVRQQGNNGKVLEKVTCSPECLVALISFSYHPGETPHDEEHVMLTPDETEVRR